MFSRVGSVNIFFKLIEVHQKIHVYFLYVYVFNLIIVFCQYCMQRERDLQSVYVICNIKEKQKTEIKQNCQCKLHL